MKKNGAAWVALAVVAVAAALMYFVVLPQMRGDKSAQELAKKAGQTAEQAKDTAQKAADKAKETAEAVKDVAGKPAEQTQDAAAKPVDQQPAADPKANVLQKMARIKAQGEQATVEFEALFAGDKQPPAEEVAAARAKLAMALKAASELQPTGDLDPATTAKVDDMKKGALQSLALLGAMPDDPIGARKAYNAVKLAMVAALDDIDLPAANTMTDAQKLANGEDVKPADQISSLAPADDTSAAPSDNVEINPADTAAVDPNLPSFDVLRVEKDGSTVIAGHSTPGAKIDVLDGDKVIASAVAGAEGDFVVVLDDPLPAGDHQIVLRAAGKDGKTLVSVEVATVSVPADKSGKLLAMVTKPGEPSRIMEMPEAGNDNTLVAQNADQAAKNVTVEAKSDQQPEAKPAETAKADEAKTEAKPDDSNAKESAAETAARSDTVDMAKADEAATKAGTSDVKPVNADANAVQKAATAPEVLVNAVEIEGNKIFVAGTARPKSIVRVYADSKLVGEISTDENGRFVADNTLPLAVGNHTIRADVLSRDGKKVEFRASVPFFRPEGEQLAAVSSDVEASHDKTMQPLANGDYDRARQEAGKAVALLKGLYNAGRTPTLEELAAARSSTEIALKTLSQIKLNDSDDPVAKQMADNTAGKAAKALALLKALPQDANAVKTALNSIDDAVTSAVAPAMETAEKQTTTATDKAEAADNTAVNRPAETQNAEVAESSKKNATAADTSRMTVVAKDATADTAKHNTEVASTDNSQPKLIEQAPLKPSDASSVIIRHGDTLWQISRRVYGLGVRYTTIYLANEDQITNPDRIMPGQIFGVPEKYLQNSEELHRERMGHKKH